MENQKSVQFLKQSRSDKTAPLRCVEYLLTILGQPDLDRELYALYNNFEPSLMATRDWIATEVGREVELRINPVKLNSALNPDDFESKIKSLSGASRRTQHPMSQYLLSGSPSDRQIKYFIWHNWHRVRRYYKLVELLPQRMPLESLGIIYENLFEESGGHKGIEGAHPKLFEKVLRALDIPVLYDDSIDLVEGIRYLNNRDRSFRSHNFVWGLAVFFAIESTSKNFEHIFRCLSQLGVPKEATVFYEAHSGLDAQHEKDLLVWILKAIREKDDQEIFLTSLSEHQRLTSAYYDAIWARLSSDSVEFPMLAPKFKTAG